MHVGRVNPKNQERRIICRYSVPRDDFVYLTHWRQERGSSVRMAFDRESVLLEHTAPCSFRPITPKLQSLEGPLVSTSTYTSISNNQC